MPDSSRVPDGSVRFVPLGGLGEVGMNCFALEQGEDILVVDCGVRFPEDDLGVDVVHPDFTWLLSNAERVRGLFLTHGHEDHIGAVPYLMSGLDVPIWGPPHALGLVRKRLAEHEFREGDVEMRVAVPGRTYDVGSFRVEPIRVAHSIVEASALAIRTAAGTVIHTGDFDFDEDPPDGEPTDEARLRELGDEGVALLLSDSTNVDVVQHGGTEKAVGRSLDALVAQAEGRVFIALFASNIQRLMLIGDIARKTGRKICVLGRSLLTQTEVSADIGRLEWPSDLRVSSEDAKSMPRREVLVLAGGTQGEPNSAMSRLAQGTHPDFALDETDTVILSSRVIPGNDRGVIRLMCDVLRRGARLHSRVTDPGVHTSGHATRLEQQKMLELVRPRTFVPVHGTLHHLLRHAEVARDKGVPHALVVENGTPVVLHAGSLRRDERVPSGIVRVGIGGVPLESGVLRERQDMARQGIATVALVRDRTGALTAPPDVVLRGIPGMGDGADVRALRGEVERAATNGRRKRLDDEAVKVEVRRAVRRFLLDVSGQKPVVDVLLLEAED
ncbi:MAG TPA: ribonuclease J [Polyangiaceae bacterium]|nr:ribonuclease J [Polyangiaceae bacterium]